MCGIVGYITTGDKEFENTRRGFLKYALMLDTLRGRDSTGVISVNKKFTVKSFKGTVTGYRMATDKKFDEQVPNGWCAIGHNRSATIGEVTLDNAHPFTFGQVTLVHNGTLARDGDSLPSYDKTLEVDSMQIALSLSAVVPKKAHEVLAQINGDFCIVWTDRRDRSINMARNRGRPMHLGLNFDRTMLVFMSDGDHLSVLTKGLNGTNASINNIYSLDTHHQLKWKLGSLKPEDIPFDPFRYPPYRGGTTNHYGMGGTGLGTQTPYIPPKQRDELTKAERKARKAWTKEERKAQKDAARMADSTTEHGVGFPINRNVSAYDGLAPRTNTDAQALSLTEYFNGLTADDLLKFVPDAQYDLNDNLVQVVGSVTLEHWNNCPWEATINFVRTEQANHHMSDDWLVRPYGITRNRGSEGIPGLLVDLLHCDYLGYNNTKKSEESSSSLIYGPDGRLINRVKMNALTNNGCINCHTNLCMADLSLYELTNNGNDLLCEKCKWDAMWPTPSEWTFVPD